MTLMMCSATSRSRTARWTNQIIYPRYRQTHHNFANVVDDHLMGITRVIHTRRQNYHLHPRQPAVSGLWRRRSPTCLSLPVMEGWRKNKLSSAPTAMPANSGSLSEWPGLPERGRDVQHLLLGWNPTGSTRRAGDVSSAWKSSSRSGARTASPSPHLSTPLHREPSSNALRISA